MKISTFLFVLLCTILAAGGMGYHLGVGTAELNRHADEIARYTLPAHNYKILIEALPERFLRADRIDLRGECVLFYRHEAIDTILCRSVTEKLLVTEVVE